MKANIQLIFFLCLYASCNVTNKSSIKQIDGYQYYEQTSPQIKIQLFGDYHFQPLKTNYFRDIDKRFIKYATNKLVKIKPEMLYTAHTIVQPYYSSLCLAYKSNLPDTVFLNEIKIQLKDYFTIRNPIVEKIKCGFKNVHKLTYQVTSILNKIATSHTEYFFRNGEFIFRFFFWTSDRDDAIISDEAENIIKEISFG